MSVKLVIFDLDGTLIDSSVDIMNALNYAIEPYHIKPLTVTGTIMMVGEGITKLIEKVAGDKVEEVRADVMNRFMEHYSNHLLDNTRQYPGVRETLERLHEGTCKKAVISNKRELLSRAVLAGLGLLTYFDIVVGSDTTPERKPSPVPVQVVLSDLHVRPHEAVFVGDSNYDVDAGRAAGVITVAVTYGYRARNVIAHADYLIDRMTDLIPLIERMNSCGVTTYRESL